MRSGVVVGAEIGMGVTGNPHCHSIGGSAGRLSVYILCVAVRRKGECMSGGFPRSHGREDVVGAVVLAIGNAVMPMG